MAPSWIFTRLGEGMTLLCDRRQWDLPGGSPLWLGLRELCLSVDFDAGLLAGGGGVTWLRRIEPEAVPASALNPPERGCARLYMGLPNLSGLMGLDAGEVLRHLERGNDPQRLELKPGRCAAGGEVLASGQPRALLSLALKSALWALLLELMEALTTSLGTTDTNGYASCKALAGARMARDLLLENLADPPGLDALATRVGLSRRVLNAHFKALYGDPVSACLQRWRMERAAAMLLRRDHSVKQVAYLVGYRHPSNFVLAFRRYTGMSPGQFQQAGRDGAPQLYSADESGAPDTP